MAEIYTPIATDVLNKNTFEPINAKQYDVDSRYLRATITNNGEKMTIPTTATVQINAQRKDGATASYAGTVNSDGTVTVPIANWMLALDDEVICDISIIAGGDKLTTMLFTINVQEASNPSGGLPPDVDPTVFEQMQLDVAELKSEALRLPTKTVTFDVNGSIRTAVYDSNPTAYSSTVTSNDYQLYLPSHIVTIDNSLLTTGTHLSVIYMNNDATDVTLGSNIQAAIQSHSLTIYYKGEFSFIDLLVVSEKELNSRLTALENTVGTVNTMLENAVNGVS